MPRAEGGFQGRIDELAQLGSALRGDERPPVITIDGSGGQGKTALAREAVERFAFAWLGGVWATSLVNLPSREVFLTNLARFLGIPVQEMTRQEELERQVLLRLSQGQPRTLIVLDNVETHDRSGQRKRYRCNQSSAIHSRAPDQAADKPAGNISQFTRLAG